MSNESFSLAKMASIIILHCLHAYRFNNADRIGIPILIWNQYYMHRGFRLGIPYHYQVILCFLRLSLCIVDFYRHSTMKASLLGVGSAQENVNIELEQYTVEKQGASRWGMRKIMRNTLSRNKEQSMTMTTTKEHYLTVKIKMRMISDHDQGCWTTSSESESESTVPCSNNQ